MSSESSHVPGGEFVFRIIVTFRSSHDVLRAEKILLGSGMKVDLIPVPREIASECGFCLLLNAAGNGSYGEIKGFESQWKVSERLVQGMCRKERLYERLV